MKDTDPNSQKYRELLKQKRRLLDKMRKHRKVLAKARVEKKRLNEEITRLRKSGFAFMGMTPAEAAKKVSGEIKDVTPADIYPKDLERKFDKLERTSEPQYRKGSVDISDLDDSPPARARSGEDNEEAFVGASEDGVVDLSDGDEPDILEGPQDEDAE